MAKITELAKLLDLSARSVRKLAANGVIPREGRGTYDLAACVKAYIAHRNRKPTVDDELDQIDWRAVVKSLGKPTEQKRRRK